MTGWICDVPLPHNVTPIRPPTEDDFEAEARRLNLVATVTYMPTYDHYSATAWDATAKKFLLRVEDSSRAGVLAKAVGELRQL